MILVNGLGATETGIVRMFTIHVDTVLEGAVVPVGYATEDMETLRVDETGAEVIVPDAIDDGAGEERILRRSHPCGEGTAGWRIEINGSRNHSTFISSCRSR